MEFYLLEVLGMDHEPKHVSTTFWVVNWMKSELLWRRQGSQVQEPPGGTYWPPGTTPEVRGVLIHEKRYFSYFSRNSNRRAVF